MFSNSNPQKELAFYWFNLDISAFTEAETKTENSKFSKIFRRENRHGIFFDGIAITSPKAL